MKSLRHNQKNETIIVAIATNIVFEAHFRDQYITLFTYYEIKTGYEKKQDIQYYINLRIIMER